MHARSSACGVGVTLSAEERLVRERRVKGYGAPDAPASCERRLPCAEDTHVDGRKSAWLQPKTAHVQPFATAFTLHHRLGLICAMADTSCAICRKAAAVCRWRCESFGAR